MSSSRNRRIVLPLAIFVLAVVATVVLIKIRPHPPRQQPASPRPVVVAHTIDREPGRIRIQAYGTVRAKRTVNLIPQVSGEIVEKSPQFEAGAVFQAGDVLLRIDDTDYALAAAQAEANVAQAEFSLAQAQEEAQVARDAWDRTGEGEATPLVLHVPQLKLARASLESAEAALRQAKMNLSRCTITAPFDGAVVSADADQGQYLRSGTAIGVIIATDIAEITVPVPDDDLAWIDMDGSDGVTTDVAVHAEFAGGVHEWPGRAVRIGGAVDERSRLVPVVIEVPEPYTPSEGRPALIEGMFVEVEFTTPAANGSVVIPRAGLRPGDQVWVITPDRKLEIRKVELARAGVHEAVIDSGLHPGERICVSNLQFATDGLPVRVEGEPAPGGGRQQQADVAGKGGE